MTTPAWVPPQLPDVTIEPEPQPTSSWMAVAGLCVVAAMGFGLGTAAWNARSEDPTGPEAQAALDRVDETIDWIASEDWNAAYGAFDQTCTDFGLPEFRAAFSPVFEFYDGHSLVAPRNEPFELDQIVLVRGTIDLGEPGRSSVRAELQFAGGGPGTASIWRLCGLRIDES